MRTSLANGLVAALSLTTSLTRALIPISDFCTVGYTYDDTWHPDREFGAKNIHGTVSDSEFCCNLCYSNNYDCAAAIWDPKTFDCKMYINEKQTGDPPENAWDKDMCPMGISQYGIVSTKVYNLTRFWIGPCWDPWDFSNGIRLVSNLTLPSFFYPSPSGSGNIWGTGRRVESHAREFTA